MASTELSCIISLSLPQKTHWSGTRRCIVTPRRLENGPSTWFRMSGLKTVLRYLKCKNILLLDSHGVALKCVNHNNKSNLYSNLVSFIHQSEEHITRKPCCLHHCFENSHSTTMNLLFPRHTLHNTLI